MKLALALSLLLTAAAAAAAQSPKTSFPEQKGVRSISLLPPTGESVPSPVRDTVAASFLEALTKELPAVRFVSSSDSVSALSTGGGLDDFNNFLTLYAKTGVVNQEALARVGGRLKTDGILLIDVQAYESQNGSWSRMRNPHNSARIQCTLFSSSGERLWQHLVNYTHTPTWTSKADTVQKISERLARRAASALAKGEQNADPKKDVEAH